MGTSHHDICQGCPNRPEFRSAAHQIGIREERLARIREEQAGIKAGSLLERLGNTGRSLSLYLDRARALDEIEAVRDIAGNLQSCDVTDCSGLLERKVAAYTLPDGETVYARETLCGVRKKLDGIPQSELDEEGWQSANPAPEVRLDLPREY